MAAATGSAEKETRKKKRKREAVDRVMSSPVDNEADHDDRPTDESPAARPRNNNLDSTPQIAIIENSTEKSP